MLKHQLVAVIAAAGLTLAACGRSNVATNPSASSADTSTRVTALIQGARAQAVSAKTVHISETIDVTAASGVTQTITSNGSMDLANHRLGLTFTLGTLGNLEIVTDGPIIYEKIPQLASALGGKVWLKIDPASLKTISVPGQLSNLFTGLAAILKNSQSQDPAQGLSLLAGVTGPITTVGPDTVRGTATTHYTFAVDESKALARLPADAQEAIKSFTTALGVTTTGVTTLPAEAWLDAKGRLVRSRVTVDRSAMTASPSPLFPGAPPLPLPKTTVVSVDFYDYGAPVSLTVPAADQTTDFTAMLRPLGGTGGG